MKRILFVTVLITLSSLIARGQQSELNTCSDIKSGTFYFYPSNSPAQFKLVRNDQEQQEIDLIKHDTSFWKIKWLDKCLFSLQFVRDTEPLSTEHLTFLNSHISLYQIQNISSDYYLFRATLDSVNHPSPLTDTIWFRPRK